jgi:membrane protease YdiL (CAAX protease family)
MGEGAQAGDALNVRVTVRERGRRDRAAALVQAVLLGMVVAAAGTIPRNVIFAANLRIAPSVPWAVPATAAWLWLWWRYIGGHGAPSSTAAERRTMLRANRITPRVWLWALVAGALGIVALVLALRLVNRMVMLPPQSLPDLSHVPRFTIFALLLAAAPVAGFVEEAAFRGYMQGPIERSHGLVVAIVVTGTMFAVAHFDFTLILWPYYVAVAAIYGVVTHLTDSIFPAIVLHTAGNTYSNLDLLLRGQAEWQAAASRDALVWVTGADAAFVQMGVAFAIVAAAALWAFRRLARTTRAHTRASTL